MKVGIVRRSERKRKDKSYGSKLGSLCSVMRLYCRAQPRPGLSERRATINRTLTRAVERVMRVDELRARPERRGTPEDDRERSVLPDSFLDRHFQADRPD